MPSIRITKEFSFEMAHALWNYDGSCRNIHGHSYLLSVTIIGKPSENLNDPKYGMVVDFGELKKWIKEAVITDFDHALVISSRAGMIEQQATKQMFGKLKIVDFQPTCENLLAYMAAKIISLLPPGLSLHSLKLRETANSYAEWYASDNE